MLFPARHRYHPRSQQDRDRERRDVAMRAQMADAIQRIEALEREQRVQFKRIAEVQLQLDELLKLVRQLASEQE